jgi:hypothetical protein
MSAQMQYPSTYPGKTNPVGRVISKKQNYQLYSKKKTIIQENLTSHPEIPGNSVTSSP